QEPSRILTDSFKTGELGALIELRDSIIPAYQDELDTMVYTLVEQVNRLHSGGSGLKAFQSLRSAVAVSASTEPLVNAGLAFSAQAGTFTIEIVDSDRNVVESYDITVDPTVDTLADIAARIDAADGTVAGGSLQASVTADNRLQIWTLGGQGFQFHGDDSGVLAALGVNTLFTGSTAEDIGINSIIDQDSDYLATSETGAVGDNGIILKIAQLRDERLMNGGTQTITEFYRATVGQIGIEGRRAEQMRNSSDLLLTALKDQRSSVSGVSIDEELINLVQAQQAFAAAARVVTMVDEMLDLVTSRLGTGGR
ncbi:MAG TPA: flagellar basal body rod C-terminal domain-containing protein, partial [bacterium]|nr:flagellar basal body rod C-terminal domain-containing protein [bacterium]